MLGELADLPFTTPDEASGPRRWTSCACPRHEIDRIVALPTSGTTGTPKRVLFTAQRQESTKDFFHIGMSTLVEPGEKGTDTASR